MPMTDPGAGLVSKDRALLLLLLLPLALAPHALAQRIPSTPKCRVPSSDLQTFRNGASMVECLELEYYLFHNKTVNKVASVPNKGGPVFITVTPCASSIKWSLYNRPKGQRGKVLLHQSSSGSSRESFYGANVPQGSLVLTLTAVDSDTYVKVFLGTDPLAAPRYPALPTNPNVDVSGQRRNLKIKWPSAKTANSWSNSSVEYCVVISRIKNFGTHCGVLAYKSGDKKPTWPRWGFRNEKLHHQRQRLAARPVKRASPSNLIQECVGEKTSFTFTKAKPGRTYFVDVFVVDKDSKVSSAYKGTSFKTQARGKRKPLRMQVGDTTTVNLKKNNGVQIVTTKTIAKLGFEVIPCSGKIRFEISINGNRRKKKTTARRWKRKVIKNAPAGTYHVTFRGKSFVTVFVTQSPSRQKLKIPQNTIIRDYEKLTTCSNVTLAWEGARRKQKYCLYKKKLRRPRGQSRAKSCLSMAERPESELVACTVFKATRKNKAIMTRKVTGLQKDAWYQFDVFVSGRDNKTAAVPYSGARVKTESLCHGN